MRTTRFFLLFLFAWSSLFIQAANPPYNYFYSGSNYPSLTPLAYGNSDLHWKVSRNINTNWATAPYAVVTPPMNPPGWWGGAPNTFGNWITAPKSMMNNCPGALANHVCASGVMDLYYRIDFNLSSTLYFMQLDMRADNSIVEIFQNSTTTPVWNTTLTPSQTSTYGGWISQVSYAFCSNWVSGNNYIIIHTRSHDTPFWDPQYNMFVDYTGLEVVAWSVNPISISGPSTLCKTASGTFNAPSIPGFSSVSYAWNFSGLPWNTTPPTNLSSISATPLSAGTGFINVDVYSGSCYLTSGSYVVTVQQQPTVTVAATSPTAVCLGGTVGLVASGATNYTWTLPGGSTLTGPSIVVTPNPAGVSVYTVTGVSNGCSSTATIAALAKPLPTVYITPNAFFVCPGIPNTLTASGASTYTWVNIPGLPSPNPNPLVVTLSPPQTVILAGTAVNGCTNTTSMTFTAGAPIPVTTSNATFCTNASQCTTLTAYSTSSWPPTFTWAPGNPGTYTVQVCPTTSTVYTVTAVAPTGCPGTAMSTVTIYTNCCSQSTVGLTELSGPLTGAINGGSYLIRNNLSVGGGYFDLKNAEILMMPGVKITVPNNNDMYIDNVHLYACGINMWQGIEVQDGAHFATHNTSGNASLIEDAETAIDIPGTSVANAVSAPNVLELNRVIFNKNNIGIRIHNGDPNITYYNTAIDECVFTSRNLPFTNYTSLPMSWPSAATTGSGLRAVTNPTTGLVAPYGMQGYAPATLKLPQSGQPAYIGIQIEDVGNTPAGPPTTGVNIATNQSYIYNNASFFNLFDNLGIGIDVQDASIRAQNNVFQNMLNFTVGGNATLGKGIYHHMTGLMNAHLDLRPFNTTSTALGNQFWDCWFPVWTDDVYKVDIEYNLFRSQRAIGSGFGPGSSGVLLFGNRFDCDIQFNEFNNIVYSVRLSPDPGPYNMGAGLVANGIYAGNVRINQNYFGPEVNSSTPNTHYSNRAIYVTGTNANGGPWQIAGSCNIISNKLDRLSRGIYFGEMDAYPVEIGGNSVLIEDDNVVDPGDQWGIYAEQAKDNVIVNFNTLSGQGVSNQRLKLVRLRDNTGNGNNPSPSVTMNSVSNAYKGFAFEGPQPDTRWECNQLYTPMNYGFCLESSNGTGGIVGPQGNACLESGNDYLPGNWNSPNYYTYCDPISVPGPSPLYVGIFNSGPTPQHAGTPGHIYGVTTFITSFTGCPGPVVNDCPYVSNYPGTPSQRMVSEPTDIDTGDAAATSINVFPNPSSGSISIRGASTGQVLQLNVTDITGKLMLQKEIVSGGSDDQAVLTLSKGIYLLELKTSGSIIRKKLIIE